MGGERRRLPPPDRFRQSGVVALRVRGGRPQVLLVTSRGDRGWVIPKGIVERGLTPARSAAKEAWEEAGVRGALSRRMAGTYRAPKWGGVCTVRVYLLAVTETARDWPEAAVRRRRWFAPAQAARRVGNEKLARLILEVTQAPRPRRTAGTRR